MLKTIFIFITLIHGAIHLLGYKYWWIIAAAGVLISQALILSCFKDAGFGTIPNTLLYNLKER